MEEKRRTENYENIGLEIPLDHEPYDFNHYNYFYKNNKEFCINISGVGDVNQNRYRPNYFNQCYQERSVNFNDVICDTDFEKDVALPKVYYFDLGSENFIRIFHNALVKAVHFRNKERFQFTLRTGEILTVTKNSINFRDIDCSPHRQLFNYQICEKIFEYFNLV